MVCPAKAGNWRCCGHADEDYFALKLYLCIALRVEGNGCTKKTT